MSEDFDIDMGEVKSIELVKKKVYCFECLKKFPKASLVQQKNWHYKGAIVPRSVFVCVGCLEKFGKTKGRV